MQSKNEFAICVYGVRCNTSYTQIANSFLDCINAKMRAQDLES